MRFERKDYAVATLCDLESQRLARNDHGKRSSRLSSKFSVVRESIEEVLKCFSTLNF